MILIGQNGIIRENELIFIAMSLVCNYHAQERMDICL